MYFVYILKCADGGFYTGCTENLDERVLRHNKGYVDSTKERIPAKLFSTVRLKRNQKLSGLKNTLNQVQELLSGISAYYEGYSFATCPLKLWQLKRLRSTSRIPPTILNW